LVILVVVAVAAAAERTSGTDGQQADQKVSHGVILVYFTPNVKKLFGENFGSKNY
jgi:hypothetical protein